MQRSCHFPLSFWFVWGVATSATASRKLHGLFIAVGPMSSLNVIH